MPARNFARWVMMQNVYLMFVILFGAFVRASGSGAGCGSHWPLCNGALVPRAPAVQTIIEFTHRLTSGLTLPIALFLVWMAWRIFPKKHPVRMGTVLTVIFLCLEAAIGAGLVLWEHVASNTSNARAVSMALHLVNTFALTATATLTWAWARAEGEGKQAGKLPWGYWLGLGLVVVTSVSGAITALGDTVFPVGSSAEAWRRSLEAGGHLFVKLRVYHPLVALGTAAYLCLWMRRAESSQPWLVRLGYGIIALQILCGFVNVHLLAPISVQLLHLMLAQSLWMTLVLLGARLRAARAHGREPQPVWEAN